MTNKFYLENGMEAVEATYSEFPIEEYSTNPFIQALPPLIDKQAIIKKLMMPIKYSKSDLELNAEYRLHMIPRIYKFFQPLPIHLDIWNMVFSLIYQGYVSRNPFDAEYRRYINHTGKQIINRSFDINARANFRTTASCATLIGYSGMGKTTVINRILSHIPQVIVHNEYNEQHFNQIQVTHITLQTPHNSSLKALTLQFFMKVDELLGTNNFKKHVSRNLSVDVMLPLMGQVANNIGLGLIIIDEIQHLQNRGIQQMMNYFVTLMNSFGVPILLIGTPASYYSIFQTEFRIARRVTGNGEIIFNNMEQDKEFEFFLESIWKYQRNRKFTPLTAEFVQAFYDETQGVSDLIVKLFVNVQAMAISSGKEEFTVGMVKKVAKEQFKLMKPMIDAIKSKNPHKMAQFEDLRRLEFTDAPTPKQEPPVPKITKATPPVQQETKAVHKAAVASIKPALNYSKDDLRVLWKDAAKCEKSIYQLLLEGDFVDDMSFWQDAGKSKC